jgi:hypothetical protein
MTPFKEGTEGMTESISSMDRRPWMAVAMMVACLLTAGCSRGVRLVPVTGRVTLNGKPLEFGAVMVQPKAGPAAQARINSDGTFRLGTFKPEDGVIPGPATIRVICRKDITPPGGEMVFGPNLIPDRYSRFDSSGLTAEIAAGMKPLEIALSAK